MQWERISLNKQISRVTGVTGKQLPILKELKTARTPEERNVAIKKLRKTAREGNERAQCVMGFLCCLGFAKKRARKQLYGAAVGRLTGPCGPGGVLLYAVGDDYYEVKDTRQDLEEAAYWYRRSSAHGYVPAQVLYGDCLFAGEGVEPDIPTAIRLYKSAADGDYAMAFRRLGDCAYLGIGIDQNTDLAIDYFQKAARLGCRDALWRLGDLYLQGEGVDRNVALAESFYEEAAEAGVASAMCMLGDRYYYDDINPPETDYTEAVRWYKKAARLEDEWGLFALGMCYFHGRGVSQSHKKAVKYFLRSGAYGCPDALWHLASCYYNGIGIKKNKKKAYRYYREAVKMYAIYNE
ncbi:MAG: sel1 repeat family protein [Eubacterium sp.]|nr:sel1 repeat family protein [Eubacterium sp.]